MLTCRTMRAAVLLSSGLLLSGVLLGLMAENAPMLMPATQVALLLVLAGAVLFAATFLVALLPGAARRLDECRH